MATTGRRPRQRYHARALFPAGHVPILARRYRLNGDHVPHDHDFVEAVLVLGGVGTHLSVHGAQPLKPVMHLPLVYVVYGRHGPQGIPE